MSTVDVLLTKFPRFVWFYDFILFTCFKDTLWYGMAGTSHRKFRGKQSRPQRCYHVIDGVLWVHRMLVTESDLVLTQ